MRKRKEGGSLPPGLNAIVMLGQMPFWLMSCPHSFRAPLLFKLVLGHYPELIGVEAETIAAICEAGVFHQS